MQETSLTTFTFLTLSDVHISDDPPRSRIDDFRGTILEKLEQTVKLSNKMGADAILIAGDLFNIKFPQRNSHGLIQDLMRVFSSSKSPVYMIEGNHDLYADRLESIKEQPLGDLFESGIVKQLRNQVLEKRGVKISLVGIPYNEHLDPKKLTIPDRDGCSSQICLLHAYASPIPGKLFREEIFGYRDFTHLGPDVFVFGHYHIDQGVSEVDGKWFINIGSLSRGTLTDERLDHKPQVGVIEVLVDQDITTHKITTHHIKIKPPEEIFDLQKHEEVKKEHQAIEQFVEKLIASGDLLNGPDKDVKDVLNGIPDLAKEIRDRAMHYIHKAGKA